jgi:hypothetical protein
LPAHHRAGREDRPEFLKGAVLEDLRLGKASLRRAFGVLPLGHSIVRYVANMLG